MSLSRPICLPILFVLLSTVVASAQRRVPPVAQLMQRLDTNKDGSLTADEVADSPYARQFPRWDANKDKQVTAKEIIAFRKRFGIAADGTLIKPKLALPEINKLTRVDSKKRPSRQEAQHSAFILKTTPHKVAGKGYAIVTDLRKETHKLALQRLQEHHSAAMFHVDDLAELYKHPDGMEKLRIQLRKLKPKYVAFAPRLASFRENMVLGMWDLLTKLDDDPQVDALPGILVASDGKSFEKLINQSIQFKPRPIRPLAISQLQRTAETRSLQKAGILRNYFSKTVGAKTPIVTVYGPNTESAPRLQGDLVWNLQLPGRRQFIKQFPKDASEAINNANLIIMHGHGIPGMSCSVDIGGLERDLTGKILLTGSCFSASPVKTDFAKMQQAPGGYEVKQRDAFVLRAIDRGAVVAFGHQRLSSGFPHLFPTLERMLQGGTVGEAYQQLINGLIEIRGTPSSGFVVTGEAATQRRIPQNTFLYILIGDPALAPFKPIPK